MAKKDLNLNWTSESKAVEKDAAKMAERIENLETKLKKVNKQARVSKQEFSGMGGSIAKIGEIAAGVFSAQLLTSGFQKAMDLIKAEFEDMLARQQRAAQALTSTTRRTADYATNWLGSGRIDDVMRTKDSVKIAGLKDIDKDAILAGFSGAAPRSTLAQGKQALQTYGQAKGMTDLAMLAEFGGEVSEFYGDEKSFADQADITFGLQQAAGKRAGDLSGGMKNVQKLVAMGVPKDEAMSMMLAAANTEQGPRALGTLSSALSMPRKSITRKPGKYLTPEQELKNKVAGMSDLEYFHWIQANPEQAKTILGSSWASIAPMFQEGVISQSNEAFEKMQSEDIFSANTKAFREQEYVKATILADDVAGATAENRQKRNTKGALAGKTREQVRVFLDDAPATSKFQKEWLQKSLELDGLFGDDYTSGAVRALEKISDTAGKKTVQRPRYIINPFGGAVQTGWEEVENRKYNPLVQAETQEMIAVLKQQKEAMEKLNSLIEESNRINKETAENTSSSSNQISTGSE